MRSRLAQTLGERLAFRAYAEFGRAMGEQGFVSRERQTIPMLDGRFADALAEEAEYVLGAYRAERVKETNVMMKRVNLNLKIVATLVDAETGKSEPTPFDANLDFNYRGVPYADALDVQESFAQAMNEHGSRMIAKGRKASAQAEK